MNQTCRRQFLLSAGALLLARRTLAQQPGRVYRVGAIFGVGGAAMQPYRDALAKGLAAHGFVEGRNLRIDARGAHGQFHQDRELARELLAAKPDALFTCTDGVTEAAHAATKKVPIVFTWVADPVASGVVKSYARPGGNVTGVTTRFGELLLKRLELARELIPAAKRVGVFGPIESTTYLAHGPALRAAAARMGIDFEEFRPGSGLSRMWQSGAEAILALYPYALSPHFSAYWMEQALKHRVLMIFPDSEAVEAGAAVAYGTNQIEDVRRAADLLARVLKGANPAELPVDQAARFELAVNLKTAKELGLKIPQSILLRADRVIE